MKAPVNEMLVMDIAGRVAVVVTDLMAAADVLMQLGFARQSDRWERAIAHDTDRQTLVAALIDLDALFSAGRDWSPRALVEPAACRRDSVGADADTTFILDRVYSCYAALTNCHQNVE